MGPPSRSRQYRSVPGGSRPGNLGGVNESSHPELLVSRLRPIALASEVLKEFAVKLRQRADVTKVARDIVCNPTYGGFDMEWQVSAFHEGPGGCRTWALRLVWLDERWVIERRVSESIPDGDERIDDFEDLHIADDDLVALVDAAKSLVKVPLEDTVQ